MAHRARTLAAPAYNELVTDVQFILSGRLTCTGVLHNEENSVRRLVQAVRYDRRKNTATEILTVSPLYSVL